MKAEDDLDQLIEQHLSGGELLPRSAETMAPCWLPPGGSFSCRRWLFHPSSLTTWKSLFVLVSAI